MTLPEPKLELALTWKTQRILVIGEASVGKTSFIQSLLACEDVDFQGLTGESALSTPLQQQHTHAKGKTIGCDISYRV